MAPTFSSRRRNGAFFDDLVRCETRLYNALDSALRLQHDIGTSQFEFLRYVRDHPDCRVADIAAYFAAGIGAVSKMTDRLQSAELVDRRTNPADRRSSFLVLTARGRQRVSKAETTFDARLAQLVAGAATAEQIAGAASVLRALRIALERAAIGLPAG